MPLRCASGDAAPAVARDAGLALRLRHVRPDVVLFFTIKQNIRQALAARSLGRPIIPNVSGLGTACLSGGVIEGLVIGLCAGVTVIRPSAGDGQTKGARSRRVESEG